MDGVVYEKNRGLDVTLKYGNAVVSLVNVAYPIGGTLEEGRVSDRACVGGGILEYALL